MGVQNFDPKLRKGWDRERHTSVLHNLERLVNRSLSLSITVPSTW